MKKRLNLNKKNFSVKKLISSPFPQIFRGAYLFPPPGGADAAGIFTHEQCRKYSCSTSEGLSLRLRNKGLGMAL